MHDQNIIKFSINTLGCKVNHSESDNIIRELVSKGMALVSMHEHPDLCIINTCTVTSRSDSKVRQLIRKIRSINPAAEIIVTGCFVRFNREFLGNFGDLSIVGNNEKENIPAVALRLFDRGKYIKKRIYAKDLNSDGDRTGIKGEADAEDITGDKNRNSQKSVTGKKDVTARPGGLQGCLSLIHSRPMVKVQDGCQQNCSYCIIPMVRGRYRSVGWENILEQIKYFEEQGFEEVVLTGIHTGKYGVDLERSSRMIKKDNISGTGLKNEDVFKKVTDGVIFNDMTHTHYGPMNLSQLICMILEESGLKRVRLSSIEVNEIDKDLMEVLEKNHKRIAPHLHIPLQSGSDFILKQMGRPYTSLYFRKKIEEVRNVRPDIAITTDVIAGFPGESERDFEDTLELVKNLNFAKLHVFKYSTRPRTRAAEMGGCVSEQEKSRRSRILIKLGTRIREDFLKRNLHRKLETVCEKFDEGKKLISGTSGNYIRTYFKSDIDCFTLLRGKIITLESFSRYRDGIMGDLSKTC